MISKEQITSQKWIIEIKGKKLPLDVIRIFIQTIFLCVLVYAAYNIGFLTALEYVKVAALFGNPSCDYTGCYLYVLNQEGATASWEKIKVGESKEDLTQGYDGFPIYTKRYIG
jgi:hypothetical protein